MPIERIRASDMKRMKNELDTATALAETLKEKHAAVLTELSSKIWTGSGKRCLCCGVHFSERHHIDCVLNNAIDLLEDEL